MSHTVQCDFHQGRKWGEEPVDVQELLASLALARRVLEDWPVDRIIGLVDGFATLLLQRGRLFQQRYPGSGTAFIADWSRASTVEGLLEAAFDTRRRLDAFTACRARSDREQRVFPRGLVVHWMAGNVPTLGFLSLLQGLLTKNANLIKAPSASDNFLADLLAVLAAVPAGGAELARCVAVVRYPHERREVAAAISAAADVRVLWGSDESLRHIQALPTGLETSDVVFPARTSLAVIEGGMLSRNAMAAICRRLAVDISLFEQKACASPHTVFLETDDPAVLEAFAEQLHAALEAALANFPKAPPSPRELSALLNLRAQYDIFHRAWYPEGTHFTILSDDTLRLGPAVGNRTVFLRKVSALEQIAELLTPAVQTVGILVSDDRFDNLTECYAKRGCVRFSRLGSMTAFESPWDGRMLPQYLVRWVSRPRGGACTSSEERLTK